MTTTSRRGCSLEPYELPAFYTEQGPEFVKPLLRLRLAHLPTPIQALLLPELPEDFPLFVKRDDYTGGIESTGNKIRKLEFLLADAMEKKVDAVFTAGGTQSNHARATVAACARLGFPAHVYLRKDSDGTNGNFFLDHLLGAHVTEMPRSEFCATSIEAIAKDWETTTGKTAYPIPIGGSSSLGSWGYIEWVNELGKQTLPARAGGSISTEYSHIVACSGSGGTLTGLGIGMHLYSTAAGTSAHDRTRVVSYGVCDTPSYFTGMVDELGSRILADCPPATSLVDMRDAKGEGYAKSTTQELQFISRVARESGLVTDFCYTGKTVFAMWRDIVGKALVPTGGRKLLYVHTGGGPSVFDKTSELLAAAKY